MRTKLPAALAVIGLFVLAVCAGCLVSLVHVYRFGRTASECRVIAGELAKLLEHDLEEHSREKGRGDIDLTRLLDGDTLLRVVELDMPVDEEGRPSDVWGRPFVAEVTSCGTVITIRVLSRGPDGVLGTPDDIAHTVEMDADWIGRTDCPASPGTGHSLPGD